MKQITETSFQQGYFKIPRTLLKQQTGSGQLENMGAFFQVLSHANYSETTYNIHGLTIFCQRGESLISNLHWSILFGRNELKIMLECNENSIRFMSKTGESDRKEDLNGMGKSQKEEMECKLVFEGRRVAVKVAGKNRGSIG